MKKREQKQAKAYFDEIINTLQESTTHVELTYGWFYEYDVAGKRLVDPIYMDEAHVEMLGRFLILNQKVPVAPFTRKGKIEGILNDN